MAVENVALIRKVKSKDHLPLADLFQVFTTIYHEAPYCYILESKHMGIDFMNIFLN